MLPASFLSTYKKYKRDTEVVASWLVATAKERGYTAPLAAPKDNAPTSGRLKGKARAQAKKHVLAIRDFVPLAEFIAGNPGAEGGEEAGVPSVIGAALDRAIRVRKAFSVQLAEFKQKLSAKANATHAHFVGVLEKVHGVLLKSDGAGDAKDTLLAAAGGDSKKQTNASDFNLFDALRLYEPSEEPQNVPDTTPPPSIDVEYTVEDDEEDSLAEALLAFVALIKDCINIREEISKLWAEYRSGNMDLATASVGTNMAVGLARSIEEEMEPLLKKHGGPIDLLPIIFETICGTQGQNPHSKQKPKDDLNFAVYELGSAFLYNVLALLEAVTRAAPYSVKDFPSYNGKFGWYEASKSRESMTNSRLKWAQEKSALLEVVSDCALLFEFKGMPVLDQFSSGIKIMFETKSVPLWVCFAAQNYLDTLHLFGSDVKSSLAEFDRFNLVSYELLNDAIKSASGRNKETVKDLEDMRNMVTIKPNGLDLFTIARQAVDQDLGRSSRPSGFFKHNPVYCGLWIHYTRAMFHQKGIAYAAKPGAVLHAVQLYKAAQQHQEQAGLQPVPEWSDLDHLLETQGNLAFFVGSEPLKSPDAHFKNFCMSRGISPTNWLDTTRRRKGKGGTVPVQKSTAGIRQLKFKAPMSLWSASRLERTKGSEPERKVWSAEFIQRLLEASGSKVDSNLPAPQLVHHVTRVIQAEMPDLLFNYYILHKTANRLLKKLEANAAGLGMPSIPADIKASIKNSVADFAGLIFAVAAGEMKSEMEQSDKVLTDVATFIVEFLTEQLPENTATLAFAAQQTTTRPASS